jgi:hypothetical protein
MVQQTYHQECVFGLLTIYSLNGQTGKQAIFLALSFVQEWP